MNRFELPQTLQALDEIRDAELHDLILRDGAAAPRWLDLCRYAAVNGTPQDCARLIAAASRMERDESISDPWDEPSETLAERAALQLLHAADHSQPLPGRSGSADAMAVDIRDAWLRNAAQREDPGLPEHERWLPREHRHPLRSCELPVLLVSRAGGVMARLSLTRVRQPNANLRLVPAPASALLPLAASFAGALRDVSAWLRSTLQPGAGLALQDIALAWDLAPMPGTKAKLGQLWAVSGGSAGAAFAVGALWLLHDAAPTAMAEALRRIRRETLLTTAITATFSAQGNWGPVGGADDKIDAMRPLLQALRESGINLPLHVHSSQLASLPLLAEWPATLERHDNLQTLLNSVAGRSDPLTPAQTRLHQALLGDGPYPQVKPDDLSQVLQQPATTLRQYALRCWAWWEDPANGPVHGHFVPLTVAADKTGRLAGLVDAKPYEDLGVLLNDHDRAGHGAYMLRGAPGAGKSTLLRHHLQTACRQALQSWARNETPAELPVYLELSELPARCGPPGAGEDDPQAVRDWLWKHLQEREHAPAELLHGLRQGQQPDQRGRLAPPLRLLLDGLNELRVEADGQRALRASTVVRALVNRALRPLPALLSVREQHFDTISQVQLVRVDVNPWQPHHIRAYLHKRFDSDTAQVRYQALEQLPHAMELCSTPMHLAGQCELWLEGCEAPADDRAALYAAWLWLRLRRELGLSEHQPKAPNPALLDPFILSPEAQEALQQGLGQDLSDPALRPRPETLGGALMAGLLQQAEAQYWHDAEGGKPGTERCAVAVPWHTALTGLKALGPPGRNETRSEEELRALWRKAVHALGLAVGSPQGASFKFSHQSWGEYLASCRLLARSPQQMQEQVPGELQRLLQHIQPPPLPRTDAEEWQHLRQSVVDRWRATVPEDFFPTLLREGLTVSLGQLRSELLGDGWQAATADERLAFMAEPARRVLTSTGEGDLHRVDLQRWGDRFGVQALMASGDGPWHAHPLGLQAFLRQWLWGPLTRRVWARLEADPRVGEQATGALRDEPGQLVLPPLGDLHEVLTLALQGLADPAAWLRHLVAEGHAVACARAATTWARRVEAAGAVVPLSKPKPELQALRRELLLRSLDASPAVREKLRAGGALAALEGAPLPVESRAEFQPLQARWQRVYGIRGENAFRPPGVDLRQRLQAGELLGHLGDTLRYESCEVRVDLQDGSTAKRCGLRLRRAHWLQVGDAGTAPTRHRLGDSRANYADERPEWQPELPAFQVAAYPVTVAEYRHFVEADGYTPGRHWWGLPGSPGQDWLTREGRREPRQWDHRLLRNPLQPVVGLTWWEACAYAAWAAPLHAGLGGALQLALPTEAHWEAAARWGWPASERPRWPHGEPNALDGALDFNHSSTRWGRPSPVGVFSVGTSPAGVADLAGNVLEWCSNRFAPGYETPDQQAAARMPAAADDADSSRAVRGGGYDYTADNARAGYRDHFHPGDDLNLIGLRLVRV